MTLIDIYISMLAVITLAAVYLDLANYYYTLSDKASLPKHAYYVLGAAIAPIILLRGRAFWSYVNAPFAFWTIAMVVLNFVHWSVLALDESAQAANVPLTRLQFLILAALIGFLLVQTRPVLMGGMFVVLALLLTALQVTDFFSPGLILPLGTEGVVTGRPGSTLINANKAAESLVLLSVLGMAALRPAWRIWLLLTVFLGVLLSFSRSGLLAWLVVLTGGFWLKSFSRSAYVYVALVIILAASVAGGSLELLLSYVDSRAATNLFDRAVFFFTLDTSDFSGQERIFVAERAIDAFMSEPLFGNGAGYTHHWATAERAPHNQHLLMLAEYGFVGYGLFLWLLVLMFRGRNYFESLDAPKMALLGFAVFMVFTPFTHNMFDHLYWLVSYSILCQRTANSRT